MGERERGLYQSLQNEYFNRGLELEKLKKEASINKEREMELEISVVKGKAEFENILGDKEKEINMIREKVASMSNSIEEVQTLRNQLQILQAAEFNVDLRDGEVDVNPVRLVNNIVIVCCIIS